MGLFKILSWAARELDKGFRVGGLEFKVESFGFRSREQNIEV